MNKINNNLYVLYSLPPDYYDYNHPDGTGKSLPPFYSSWFIGNINQTIKNNTLLNYKKYIRKAGEKGKYNGISFSSSSSSSTTSSSSNAATTTPSSSSSSTGIIIPNSINKLRRISFILFKCIESIKEIISLGLVVEKRPNPKQRKKMNNGK